MLDATILSVSATKKFDTHRGLPPLLFWFIVASVECNVISAYGVIPVVMRSVRISEKSVCQN